LNKSKKLISIITKTLIVKLVGFQMKLAYPKYVVVDMSFI